MSRPRRIESTANPKLKAWRAFQERRKRDATGRFIIEGQREVSRALAAGIRIEAVLTDEDASSQAQGLAERAASGGAEQYELSRQALERLSRRQKPPQVIVIAYQPSWSLEALAVDQPSLVLIADAVEKPGNLGAMMRTADGAGADAFIVSDPATDLANPNVIRASQGALFSFPIAAAPAEAVGAWVERHQLNVVVANDDGTGGLWDTDLTVPTAIVIGSEDRGVSAAWRENRSVAIPMAGASDSLNASVAAAVFLFEAQRQRRIGS